MNQYTIKLKMSHDEYVETQRVLAEMVQRSTSVESLVVEHLRTKLAEGAVERDEHAYVARYTRRMMRDFQRDGYTIQIVTYGDAREDSRQRGRMYNAGRRLGLTITTTSERCTLVDHPNCQDMVITGRITGGDGTVRPPVGGTE